MSDSTVLSPDFARRIRESREKKGLSVEQLGMQMNEKAAFLRKIESGALKPDESFADKLERFLGIRLYLSSSEMEEDSDD
jgi:putative transcription factor